MKSSNSFQAVYYNEHKITEQKAELLAAVNFEGSLTAVDFLSKNDYIKYFHEVSKMNPRVKRKQFHAVISTKGKEHTAEELKTIAEEYIKRMGYSKNPYLLYFHQDTENNHIHIVSSRVDTEGVKVNDSFEKKESLRHINDIVQQIPHRELNGKTLIEDIMKYQFSTEAQLKLLIERKGYTAQTDADRNLLIQKDTRTIGTVDRKAISEKLKNKPDGERIKQLRAIFHKYQTDSTEEFQKLMKEKFGVELIFHRAGGHETPYGYTVIDHATKQVFKGSDVFKLSELLKNRVGEGRENRHIEALKEQQNDKDKFDDYMNQQDLFLMSKGGNTFMIDRANNEVTNVSSHSFFKGHVFMDMDDSQKMTQGIDLNLGISGAEVQETDRKKKRSTSR